jgi:hypothetical protein
VCEVVSPSTGRLDRTKKLGVYAARAGVEPFGGLPVDLSRWWLEATTETASG